MLSQIHLIILFIACHLVTLPLTISDFTTLIDELNIDKKTNFAKLA